MKPYSIAVRSQAGLGVLPVALILLAGAALMLLFSQKNLLVDLKITQNGYASRIAYAVADSGLALALSRLNDPEQRKALLADTKGNGAYDAISQPVITQTMGEGVEARIKLKGIALGGPDIRLLVQSTGCVSDCTKGRATVSQTLAMRGGIQQIPYALLSARGSLDVSGPVTLSNPSAAVRGMLMHAGGSVTHDASVQRISLPGLNPDQAEVLNDKIYVQTSGDAFFQQWFGADKAFIRGQATRISCQGECAGSVAAAGSRVIWLDGDARLSSGTIGTAAAPAIMIASGNLQLSGSVRITGVVYSQAPITQVQLTTGTLDGALIAENRLVVSTGGTLSYNPVVLQRAQSMLGAFVAVPGSWSDGE